MQGPERRGSGPNDVRAIISRSAELPVLGPQVPIDPGARRLASHCPLGAGMHGIDDGAEVAHKSFGEAAFATVDEREEATRPLGFLGEGSMGRSHVCGSVGLVAVLLSWHAGTVNRPCSRRRPFPPRRPRRRVRGLRGSRRSAEAPGRSGRPALEALLSTRLRLFGPRARATGSRRSRSGFPSRRSHRGNRVAVPWNTVFGFVWNIQTVLSSDATTMSKLGPPVKTSVPVQSGSTV